MKKHFLIFAALVATMTGCVKNEVMDVSDSGEISFDTYVGKHTRAVVINGRTDLSRFYVYGNMTNADDTEPERVFESEDVVWAGTSAQNGHYEYNGGVSTMWKAGKKYYFAAVSNGNAAFSADDVIAPEVFNPDDRVNFSYDFFGTGDNNQITITNYTVKDKDLIIDIADPIVTGESMVGKETVTFDFRHLLTRVRFVINNGDAIGSNQIVAVEDLKFSGAKTGNCTYKLTAPNTHTIAWGDFGSDDEYEYTVPDVDPADDKYVITPSSNKSFGHFVIPQSSEDKEVTFKLVTYHREEDTPGNYTYTRTDSQEYTFSLKYDNDKTAEEDYDWHPGKVYQYTVTLVGTTSYIRFDANVASWNFDINGDTSSNSADDIPMTNN